MACVLMPRQRYRFASRSKPACVIYHLPPTIVRSPSATDNRCRPTSCSNLDCKCLEICCGQVRLAQRSSARMQLAGTVPFINHLKINPTYDITTMISYVWHHKKRTKRKHLLQLSSE